MVIKILGTGCPNCLKLEEMAKKAAQELNLSAEFVKVKEIEQILEYGIVRTPGLVINEVVKASGRIPAVAEIKTWMQQAL
ncbi:thioredoxin family protein [candidate division KSB1 bacterium]|nr:thioredoxin family protein [candidate division KSB1 bacterium]